MTIEDLAQMMAVGNNGGTWSDHYTDDQKNVWRDRARDVLAKMTEKAGPMPADDELVDWLETWAETGLSVTPESALALIARIRRDQTKLTLQETISKQAMDHGSLKANQYVEACRERDAALDRIKTMDNALREAETTLRIEGLDWQAEAARAARKAAS